MLQVVAPAALNRWLTQHVAGLDGDRPIDLVARGTGRRIIRVCRAAAKRAPAKRKAAKKKAPARRR